MEIIRVNRYSDNSLYIPLYSKLTPVDTYYLILKFIEKDEKEKKYLLEKEV